MGQTARQDNIAAAITQQGQGREGQPQRQQVGPHVYDPVARPAVPFTGPGAVIVCGGVGGAAIKEPCDIAALDHGVGATSIMPLSLSDPNVYHGLQPFIA